MTLIATSTSYGYPIYGYLGKVYFNAEERLARADELHVPIENAADGYCFKIQCPNCPIQKECGDNSPIYHFFPELKHAYPELFI